MNNQSTILEAIRNNPGIGPAGLAEALGMHKPNARRDALLLAKKGLVEARENGNGYAFFPVGASPNILTNSLFGTREAKTILEVKPPDRKNRSDTDFRSPTAQAPQVIEAEFREVPRTGGAAAACAGEGAHRAVRALSDSRAGCHADQSDVRRRPRRLGNLGRVTTGTA